MKKHMKVVANSLTAEQMSAEEELEAMEVIEELESMGFDTTDRGEILEGLGAGLGYDHTDQQILLRQIEAINARRLYGIRGATKSGRKVVAASEAAERFADLHDTGDFEKYGKVYDQVYSILEEYGTENDPVHELYDRATPEDQAKLMQLMESVHGRQSNGVSRESVLQKYHKLVNKSERGNTSAYEDGYLDALSDVASAFGLTDFSM